MNLGRSTPVETASKGMETQDIVTIGGGQMGLSLGYYLHRAKADFLILDAEDGPGGVLRHSWNSMRLFLPAGYSSLSTWGPPKTPSPMAA